MLCHEIIKNHINNKATFLHQNKIVPISFPKNFNPLITTAYCCPKQELLNLQPSYHAAQVPLKWMCFLESFPSWQIQNEGLNYLSSFCLFIPLFHAPQKCLLSSLSNLLSIISRKNRLTCLTISDGFLWLGCTRNNRFCTKCQEKAPWCVQWCWKQSRIKK